jgi:hypothetical protein
MSVKSVCYISLGPKMFNPSFNELSIFNNICVYTYVFLITLMLVNMFVFNVNMFVNSCNVLHICK